MATCRQCGAALAAGSAQGDICVLSPDGTSYLHLPPVLPELKALAAKELGPSEPAMGAAEVEVVVKPKRRSK